MRNLFCFIFLCLFSVSSGQFTEPKFGKIEVSDLTMSKYDKDTTAGALILFNNGFSKFILNNQRQFQFVYDIHCRIKIFKNSALNIADVSIKLYESGSRKEKLSDLKAVTYNLVDGKIIKTKLDNDKIYTVEGDNYIIEKFAMTKTTNKVRLN